MNTQSNTQRLGKSMIVFLGMVFLLAGGGMLAGQSFGVIMTGPVFMFLFALGFFGLVLWSKKNWWAIIPGGIFSSGGLAAALDILIPHSKVTGPVFLFLLAATFIIVVILSKKNWWAMIPGGIFFSIGLVVVLDTLIPHEEYPRIHGMLIWGFYTWVLFLGLATTFGILWLLRKNLPTSWAIYPAVGFLAMAVLFIVEGARFSEYWLETMLLVFGLTLLLAVLTGKRLAAGQQEPKINA